MGNLHEQINNARCVGEFTLEIFMAKLLFVVVAIALFSILFFNFVQFIGFGIDLYVKQVFV